MYEMTSEELDAFCKKVNDFKDSLEDKEKPLFHAILKVAWGTYVEGEPEEGFDGCFSPNDASMFLKYAVSPDLVQGLTGRAVRTFLSRDLVK
jgi:hypothetical protein